MAENPFLQDLPQTTQAPVQPQEPKPLDAQQRFIIQNIFDTQPEKRKAYLKQLGFEMNPKDDNEYRPIGSDIPFAEIDPGVGFYFKKGALAEKGKEFVKDVGDVTYDMVAATPITAFFAAKGAAIGTAAGTPAGPAGAGTGAVVGTILGGATGNETSEMFKNQAADLLLDENIPQDHKLTALQSLVSGAAPVLFKGGKAAALEIQKLVVDSRKKAIINAVKSSGGGVTPELLEKAGKNPEMFTKEAVDGATNRLKDMYKNIFGLDEPTKLSAPESLKTGIFRDAIDPLNKQAEIEIERLAKNPKASFSATELKKPLEDVVNTISFNKFPTEEEKKALQYLKKTIGDIDNVSKETQGILSFKDARNLVKKIQNDAFDREVEGSGFLKRMSGGDPNGLLNLIDKRAAQQGSVLPQLNDKRNQILKTYNAAQDALTPQNIQGAFINDDTIKKLMVRGVVFEMDKTLGTNYTQAIENGAFQRVIENMYQNPKNFGSGRVTAEALSGATKGALGGAAAGAGTGALIGGPAGAVPGAAIGAVTGGLAGASTAASLASPELAIQAIQRSTAKSQALEQELAKGLLGQQIPAATTLGVEAGRELVPGEVKEEVNPFLEGL